MNEPSASSEIAARKLLRWSNILAWPAVVILILGVPQVSDAAGQTAAVLVAAVSIAMIVVGTILGQRGKKQLKTLARK